MRSTEGFPARRASESIVALEDVRPSRTHHEGQWSMFPLGDAMTCECECSACWHAAEGCLCADCTAPSHAHERVDKGSHRPDDEGMACAVCGECWPCFTEAQKGSQ